MSEEAAPAPGSSKSLMDSTKAVLLEKAEQMRAELVKAADKVKELPQVKKAMTMYDEQMEKLRQASETETAKKIFDLITKAKEAIIAAIEAAQKSPMGQAAISKLNELQGQAQAKIADIQAQAKAKMSGATGGGSKPE
jgi:proline racemase